MEEWRGIEGFPLYAISDEGRVKNVVTDHILQPQQSNSGYLQAPLRRDGRRYVRYIHRLVAQTFIDSEIDNLEVNHLDGDKWHNFVKNLEICTPSQNSQHAYDTGLKVVTWEKRVRIVELGEEFPSVTAAATRVGRSINAVSNALRRGTTSAKMHYEYVKEA